MVIKKYHIFFNLLRMLVLLIWQHCIPIIRKALGAWEEKSFSGRIFF